LLFVAAMELFRRTGSGLPPRRCHVRSLVHAKTSASATLLLLVICGGIIAQTNDEPSRSSAAHLNTLGIEAFKAGKFAEAAAYYAHAVAVSADFSDAYFNLGVAYSKLSRYQEAMTAFRRTVLLNGGFEPAHYNLGVAAFKGGQYPDAVEAFRTFIRFQPRSSEAYNNLGVSYFKLKSFPEAITSLQKAIELKSDYAEAYYNLGETFCAMKDRGAALQQYNKLQALNAALSRKLEILIFKDKIVALKPRDR
jgi:tetratricopeptide (TPR) repeat protein